MSFDRAYSDGLVNSVGAVIPADDVNAAGPIISQTEFEAMLGTGGTGPWEDTMHIVKLPPNSTVLIERYYCPKIPQYTRITSEDPRRPATIKAQSEIGDRSQVAAMIVLAGRNIQFEHLRWDFNTGPQYIESLTGIRMYAVQGDTDTFEDVSGFRCFNVEFFDSDPPQNRWVDYTDPGSGYLSTDNWAINCSHTYASTCTTFEVINCSLVNRPYMQITSGGYGQGWQGLNVHRCFVNKGQAGSIQFTNNSSNDPGDVRLFQDVSIKDNVILKGGNTNIYVGSDASDPTLQVSVKNCTVSGNYVQLDDREPKRDGDADYPTCCLIRALGAGVLEDITITGNTFNILEAEANGRQPRTISTTAPGPHEVEIDDNHVVGPWINVFSADTTIVHKRRQSGSRMPEAYTVKDKLAVLDIPEKTRNVGEDDIGEFIARKGVDLYVANGTATEQVTGAFFNETSTNAFLDDKFITFNLSGHNNAVANFQFNLQESAYPTEVTWIIRSPPQQKPVTFALAGGGNIYWDTVPDFENTIPASSRVLIRFRFTGVDAYGTYEVMT